MVVPTYLKKRQEKRVSKYHLIQNNISSQYQVLKQKLSSKFHRQDKLERDGVDQSTLNFVEKYDFFLERQDEEINIRELTMPFKALSKDKKISLSRNRLDWTRGRISGTVSLIVVRDGVIIEKVFLTPKGNKVSVKRSEMGILSIF
ncbi:hypothetical protein [Prochlorococcus sp. MIT 1307]|uniref:hypothetical protein n=1 Tax=Prochlorococcus sp. MIT 1307 TaxID=3096219 RepID=UPI002A764CF4|nr:hypothetical protein [Prochlorococcus sp. MIT 1307]